MDLNINDMEKRKVHYRKIGKGPGVVLLHGFGEDGNIWHNQESILSENYTLIIPDIPGSGNSELLDAKDVQMSDYAESLKEILDNEKINEFTLIGHSMGGYIALAFAEKYPAALNGLGLFHSSAFADNEDKIATRRKSIDFIKEQGAEAFLKTSIPGLYAEQFKKDHPEKVEAHVHSAKFSKEALIQYYEAMINRPDRTAVLKTLNIPVLFIIGELDQAIPLEQSLKQCHIPRISHIHILPDVAHMGMVEATAQGNGFLLKFLQNI